MGFKPWLLIPPKIAHDLSPWALKLLSFFNKRNHTEWNSLDWQGLHFENPVGIAGGVDKNAEQVKAWWSLDVGFVEVGTVTPKPQTANPGTIMARNTQHKAVWNKMGFPSKGATFVKKQLLSLPKKRVTPIFINIGKNRDTPNEKAHEDYLYLLNEFNELADAFVINISSPNTKGLRELLKPKNLEAFLTPLTQDKRKPLLLKLSPDMSPEELRVAIHVSDQLDFDGWILTNTTTKRPIKGFPEEGGLSGQPLRPIALETLKYLVEILGDRKKDKLIVAAGGIMSYTDVQERLRLGAHLVQVYSALIFEGPGFFKKLKTERSQIPK